MSVANNPEEARVPPVLPPPPLPVSKFKVALCQLSVTADKKRNIVHAKKAIEEVAGKGAELVILLIKSPPGEAKKRRSVPVSRRTEDELALNVAETYPNRGNVGTL